MALTERLAARGHTGRVVRGLCWLAVVGSWALCGLAAHAALQSPGEGQRGQRVFQHCYACHSVQPGELNLPGPNLHGVVGRTAGTLASFEDYSGAMRAAGRRGLIWNAQTLDAFLEDPERVVPGTSMTFVGLRSKPDRDAVIAHVQQAKPRR